MRNKVWQYGTAVLLAAVLCTGCDAHEAKTEVYIDDTPQETPITLFTQNESVSGAIEQCCRTLLEKEGQNLTLYADAGSFYAGEGLSYRELLLKRLSAEKGMTCTSFRRRM